MKTLTVKIQFADWLENQIEETKNLIDLYKDSDMQERVTYSKGVLASLECAKTAFEKALIK